jgi:hypothetical protein
MAKTIKIAGNPEIDPALPKVEIKLGTETFYLCFSFGALALAQKHLRDAGVECNLLHALDLSSMDALKVVPMLYAALITHQPKITLDKVASLVTLKNLGAIFEGITRAYIASLADPSDEDKKADPIEPE